MREILFRGKRTDNGEWTYGYYCPKPYSHFPCEATIFPSETIDRDWHGERVDPDTVGQFTGLTDRNGVKIFEGISSITMANPDMSDLTRKTPNFLFSSKHGVQDLIAFIAIGMQKLSATSTTKCAKTAIPELLEVSGNE